MKADEAEPDPEKVHLTARVPLDPPADVVKDEARKGYDLMFIGLEDSVEEDGGFAPELTQLAAGFEGPLVVFANAGGRRCQLTPQPASWCRSMARRIAPRRRNRLCPGARHRRAGACAVRLPDRRAFAHPRCARNGVLKDMTELGERYDVPVTTRISPRAAAAGADPQGGKAQLLP